MGKFNETLASDGVLLAGEDLQPSLKPAPAVDMPRPANHRNQQANSRRSLLPLQHPELPAAVHSPGQSDDAQPLRLSGQGTLEFRRQPKAKVPGSGLSPVRERRWHEVSTDPDRIVRFPAPSTEYAQGTTRTGLPGNLEPDTEAANRMPTCPPQGQQPMDRPIRSNPKGRSRGRGGTPSPDCGPQAMCGVADQATASMDFGTMPVASATSFTSSPASAWRPVSALE